MGDSTFFLKNEIPVEFRFLGTIKLFNENLCRFLNDFEKKVSILYKFFFKYFLSKIFKRSSDFATILCEGLRKISKKI